MKKGLGKLYEKTVLKVLKAIGFFNSLVLLSLFYYLILGPMAIIRSLWRETGGGEKRKGNSYWVKRSEGDFGNELVRQF